jgi:hypothetical protein
MKTINTIVTIVKFFVILAIAAVALGFVCPCGVHAQTPEQASVSTTEQLLIEAAATIDSVRSELESSKRKIVELEKREAEITAEVQERAKTKVKEAKVSKNHTIHLTQGENVLLVKKSSAGFFSASVSNRTFATVNQGYVTLKAGKNIKKKLFAKAKCAPKSKTCEIKIYVNGPGSLVYGNLYRVFGYENLAVRRVFEIKQDLKVSVPKSVTLKAQPDA